MDGLSLRDQTTTDFVFSSQQAISNPTGPEEVTETHMPDAQDSVESESFDETILFSQPTANPEIKDDLEIGDSMEFQFGNSEKYVADPKECESLIADDRQKSVRTIYVFTEILEQCEEQLLQLESLELINAQLKRIWTVESSQMEWVSVLKKLISKPNSKVKIGSIKDVKGLELIPSLMFFQKKDLFAYFLKYVQDINQKDFVGATALHYAAYQNRPSYVKPLIERGADINAVENDKRTPLYMALDKKHDSVTDILLNHPDTDVNQPSVKGITPLLMALYIGRLDFAKRIIQKGAKVDIQDKSMNTPLISATLFDDFTLVNDILQKGVNVDVKSKQMDRTALMIAVENQNIQIVDAIQKYNPDHTISDKKGKTAFQMAVESGRIDVVRALLPSKALNIAEAEYGNTPLIAAVHLEFSEITKMLMKQKGIQVDIKNKQGATAITYAILDDRIDLVKLLLPQSLNVIDGNGYSPLIYALALNQMEIAKLLMEKKPNLNHCTPNGVTALKLAFSRSMDIAAEILRRRTVIAASSIENDSAVVESKEILHLTKVELEAIKKSSDLTRLIADANIQLIECTLGSK